MGRKTIVFGTTKTVAYEKLNEMLGNMLIKDVEDVNTNGKDMIVRLNNGDIYEIAVANNSSLGKRCDYAYVDKNIEIETLSTIILPCILRNKDANEENLFFY